MTIDTTRRARRGFKSVIGLAALALATSGCLYFPAALRTGAASGGAVQPWWCAGSPAISNAQCSTFSAQLDLMLPGALQYPTLAAATAAGATPAPSLIGAGFAYYRPGIPAAAGAFTPQAPQLLLYAGTDPSSQLAGVAHLVTDGTSTPPSGYPGDRDTWVPGFNNEFMLPMWVIRGYENHPNVFASGHPCLATDVTLTATTDPCFVASHTDPLDVLVTNDDGIGAPGIDAIVEGLILVAGVDVTVVAPATNQSGTSDTTTPGGVTSIAATTASGFAGRAVAGTPADSVLHALRVLHETPDLVVSGINEGQNMGPIIAASGTVGAARTAARNGIPTVATSQGIGNGTPNFPAGTAATLAWLEQFRLGRAGGPFMAVPNINIPTCSAGTTVRGTLNTVVAPNLIGRNYFAQNCASTITVINDDIDAFNNGFVGIADAGLG